MKKKWIAGIAATVISGVIVWWLTVWLLPVPNKPPSPIGFLGNWAGNWICKCKSHQMNLTITGQGWSSSLKGHYPVAYGNKPANEEYIIKDITNANVSGEYLYYDENPNIGYQGTPGVWKGTWSMTLEGNRIYLTRKDHTTSWQGEYLCSKR